MPQTSSSATSHNLLFAFALIMVLFVFGTIYSKTTAQHEHNTDALKSSGTVDAFMRSEIEEKFPQFKDFENQKSFAGRKVEYDVYGGDYYFVYEVLGSGLPIAQATCFRVDRLGRAYMIGEFPDPLDSYAGYAQIDPRTCKGIRQ